MAKTSRSGVGGPEGLNAEPICAACARLKGLVCCQLPPEMPTEKLATLTFADIERIEEGTGLPRRRFVEEEQLDPMERLYYETSRPIYRGMFVGGRRHGLKASRGACVFFEPGKGCKLPNDLKPAACHLYPFDFDLLGNLRLVEAPDCHALDEANSWSDLFRSFRTSRRTLERLRTRMLREATEHAARLAAG